MSAKKTVKPKKSVKKVTKTKATTKAKPKKAAKPLLSDKIPSDLKTLLKRVLLHQDIEEWANKPNPAFGGKKPVTVWKQKPHEIKAMVYRIEHGVAL